MARLRDITFDCAHPAALARFWADVLDGYRVAPYDEAELARLRSIGVDDPEDDPTVLIEPETDGDGLRFFFQRVPEPKQVKNRVHLDLAPSDLEAEVTRLTDLGARVLARPESGLVVLADPEGNELCLVP